MRRAPNKILYQEALEPGEENGRVVLSKQEAAMERADEGEQKILDMANRKRNTGYASR